MATMHWITRTTLFGNHKTLCGKTIPKGVYQSGSNVTCGTCKRKAKKGK